MRRYKLYAVWIGTDVMGFEKGKAYFIHISTYYKSPRITMVGRNDVYKEYESLVSFLWDWKYIKLER